MKLFIRITDVIAVLLIIVLTITVFAQVVSRFIIPIPWSEEFAKIALMWITYIGLLGSFYHDIHIRFDIIDKFLSKRSRKITDFVFYNLFGIFFGYFLLVSSLDFYFSQLEFGQTTTVLKWPIYIISIPFIIGGFLTLVYFGFTSIVMLVKAFGYQVDSSIMKRKLSIFPFSKNGHN